MVKYILISQLTRIICFNQTIYDDLRLEWDEYVGLTLEVGDGALTTVKTLVEPMRGDAAIQILDNDSMSFTENPHS